MLEQVKLEFPEAPKLYLKPLLPQWMEAFEKILTSSADVGAGELGLRLEIVRTLTDLASSFVKLFLPYAPRFLGIVGHHLQNLVPRYIADVVNSEDDDDEALACRDSDGEVIRIETLLYQYFEFLGTLASKPQYDAYFTGKDAGSTLQVLVKIVLSYMMLTNEQVKPLLLSRGSEQLALICAFALDRSTRGART